MASLQSSSLIYSSCSSRRITAAIHLPNIKKVNFSIPKLPTTRKNLVVEELNIMERFTTIPKQDHESSPSSPSSPSNSISTKQLYMILEVVSDRVEMHKNIGEQRNNWNTLLLNSINMITLTAVTMSGISATTVALGGLGTPLLALKLSSALLFSAATGLLAVMNKIQPSQLVEEQRNATKLFKQLRGEIQTLLAVRRPTRKDVKIMEAKVLALDRAYPLPLLGKMLEKFPETLEPACWWAPQNEKDNSVMNGMRREKNGWSENLEMEMREIVEVINKKDIEDYVRLGNMALKMNKMLAISGPALTGIAAIAAAFVGSSSNVVGSCAVTVSVVSGALASIVNTLEHGGQVGMVFEMYRNCAGFFRLLEDSIESTLDETEFERRENGELFEMKVALQLGRSLPQLRELATNSANSGRDKETPLMSLLASFCRFVVFYVTHSFCNYA